MTVADDKPALGFNTVSVLVWTLSAAGMLAVAGVWPTYALAGLRGLKSMFAAGLIVAGVACIAMSLVGLAAPLGGGRLAMVFIFSGMAKVIACAALGLAVSMLLPVAGGVLLLWLVLFYVAVLVAQIIWLTKVLRSYGR